MEINRCGLGILGCMALVAHEHSADTFRRGSVIGVSPTQNEGARTCTIKPQSIGGVPNTQKNTGPITLDGSHEIPTTKRTIISENDTGLPTQNEMPPSNNGVLDATSAKTLHDSASITITEPERFVDFSADSAIPSLATPSTIQSDFGRRSSTLPTTAAARKGLPLWTGFVMYFPDVFPEVAKVSVLGNQQHNPGQPLHWERGKSTDQMDAAFRHMLDHGMGTTKDTDGTYHLAKAIWRLCAELQLTIEKERK